MRQRVLKWLKRVVLGLGTLILGILFLLAGLLLTNAGLNALLWGAEKAVPQLEVKGSQGALLTGFTLYGSQYSASSPDMNLTGEEIRLKLDLNCLLSKTVCVEELGLTGVDFRLSGLPASAPEEETENQEPVREIRLPLAVQVQSLELNEINLDILGHKVKWERFDTRLEMQGSQLTVYPTRFEELTVSLALEPEEAPEPVSEAEDKLPITLPEVWIPLDIDLKDFELSGFTLDGDSPLVVNSFALSSAAQGHNVSISRLELDMPQAELSLVSELELKEGYPLSLQATSVVKEGELSSQSIDLNASGSVEALTLDAKLEGLIKAVLKGEINPLDPDLPFDLTLSEGSVQWPLSGESDFDADVEAIALKGSLKGYQLDLKTQIEGKTIPGLGVALKGEGDLNQIDLSAIRIKTLGGEVSGRVKTNWQPPLNWEADLSLKDIEPSLQWPQAEGKLSGKLSTEGELLSSGGWKVSLPLLDIEGVIREYPLDLEGDIKVSDTSGNGDIHLQTQGLGLKHGPNGIHVSGNLDKEWALRVALDIPELAKSIPEVRGFASGEMNISGPLKEPVITTDIRAGDIGYLEQVTLSQLQLSGEVSPLPEPKAVLTLTAGNISLENQVIDTITLSLNGSQKEHSLNLNMNSEPLKAELSVDGGLKTEKEIVWSGKLSDAGFSTIQGPWKLDRPVAINAFVDKQEVTVSPHCWGQSDARVCLQKEMNIGKAGEAYLEVENFDFRQLDMFMPQGTRVNGSVSATGQFLWSPDGKPELSVELSMPPGRVIQQIDQPVDIGWNSVKLKARLKNDTLSAEGLIDVEDNGDMEVSLYVEDVQSTQQAMDARLKLQDINLEMIQPLIGEYSKADAEINSDIRVTGPVKHPQVFGELIVDKIIAQGEITPVEVKSGRLVASFSGYDAVLDADIETPDGNLTLDGKADWRDLSEWSAALNINAEELKVSLPPMIDVRVTPDLQIAVTPQRARIVGDIYLPWGRINVEELPPSAIEVSSDEIILNRDLQPVDQQAAMPMDVETRVSIHIGDDFRLSAFGLQGELNGKLDVSQKDKGPFIVGEVEISNGVYRSFGQDLIIKEGKVLMNGPVDQPYLAVEAIRNPDNTSDDVTAGIRVTGPANEPSIEVFSEPAMPQQNALSYLLRGQDIDGAAGGSAMTTALIGLSLAKSGRLIGQIGETFGVSDLQLDTEGSGDDSQVTVSGYLTPDLQLKYGVGIFDSFGEFTIRYRLLTDLYLEAVSGMDSAVDLLYQFEFD